MAGNIKETINLLIVDDKAENVEALELSLEQDGLNIFTTTSPKSVVQKCIDNSISIALIDVKMPELDGFELLDLLKKNPLTENIMVILITAYSMNTDDVVKGLNKGAVDYLFKPLDLYITIAKVKSLITLVNYQREIVKKNSELESYQDELFRAIEQTEKSKILKENFLANMSHEIRTPLNAIIGLTYLLMDTPLNADQLEMIKLMDFSTKSLLGIVNDILESSQIDAGKIMIKRSPANLINLVRNICDLTTPMAEGKGLKLICEIDDDVPSTVMADSLRLNQILINLINNSIKFTESGTVTISVKVIERLDDDVLIQIIVKDTGRGIPGSDLDTIFNRFEQVDNNSAQKFGGTGLGLSIVKRLVELKGGTLQVESTLGAGTSFNYTNLYKVVEEKKGSFVTATQVSHFPKFDNVSILLAEDDPVNRFVALKMLRQWGIKADIAVNGLEAFEKLETNSYDLVLMDTHMPVMDGIEATKKIRKELIAGKKDIPVISFSASVMEREKERARLAGADDFVEKPFEPQILNSKIRKLIGNKELINNRHIYNDQV